MKHFVAPSILTADFSNLEKVIQMLNSSNADYIHIDVMDGVFVPNITFGFQLIKSIKKLSLKPLDVHLMIVQPERYFTEFHDAGADLICFHYEASIHLHRSIQLVKELGIKVGVALNPHSPVNVLEDVLHELDMVLLMTVNPGYGGQKFIENSYSKIQRLKNMISEKQLKTLIEVDGGVDLKNASKLVASGVDILVAGNTIFASNDPVSAIISLKNA
jgi:ribulose-phosphate 3-epimerase